MKPHFCPLTLPSPPGRRGERVKEALFERRFGGKRSRPLELRHYGVFHGRQWQTETYPKVKALIRAGLDAAA